MVTAVRRGTSIHEVAKRFGVSRSTVQRWIQRAGKKRLDRVDWSDRPAGRREPINKTSGNIESLVLGIRRDLKEKSALGEYGAVAISREMKKRRVKSAPSIRTIGRILERRGALDGRKRTRRPAPPNATGKATVLGHTFSIDRNWLNRLVRAEVDLAHDCIRFYPLRRRDPTYQPLLREASYHFPQRKFHK